MSSRGLGNRRKMEDKNNKLIECDCGCGILQLASDMWEGQEEITISYYLPGFYAYQSPGWFGLKERLHLIWSAITGKQYKLYEIILDGKNLEDFKVKMKEFIE
jgi:hypothetical protein